MAHIFGVLCYCDAVRIEVPIYLLLHLAFRGNIPARVSRRQLRRTSAASCVSVTQCAYRSAEPPVPNFARQLLPAAPSAGAGAAAAPAVDA